MTVVLPLVAPRFVGPVKNTPNGIVSSSQKSCQMAVVHVRLPYGRFDAPTAEHPIHTLLLLQSFAVLPTSPNMVLRKAADSSLESLWVCHVIPRHLLANVSHDTVRECLQIAQRNAKEQIEAIRAENNPDFKSGRAHGFWVQQYANTTLALT